MTPKTPRRPRPARAAVHVTHEGVLHRLHFWTEAEWEALPAGSRPALAEYLDGLCWVGAVPVQGLN
jgi:hypothetical protein